MIVSHAVVHTWSCVCSCCPYVYMIEQRSPIPHCWCMFEKAVQVAVLECTQSHRNIALLNPVLYFRCRLCSHHVVHPEGHSQSLYVCAWVCVSKKERVTDARHKMATACVSWVVVSAVGSCAMYIPLQTGGSSLQVSSD